MSKLDIDRFEGDIAVCIDENGSSIEIPKSELPSGAHAGSILVKTGNSYTVDEQGTAERAQRIAKKMDDIFKD